ncbi:MAG TPA: GTP-binding protein, partial [Terriglobales bacterium]|nr:GTP-binding protein [Terriglobales bacterium]
MSTVLNPALTAEEFFRGEQQKDLVRLVTAGSVDDGKSTLLGRLLYDSQSVYEDQLHAVKRASRGDLELALLTDGLRAEREQGITIDVAYRYFSTAKRKFILADTPGHEQYTRNMATGASNADLAILLVDSSRGIQPQSKRHAYIIGLLGIRHLVVVINKMDLVGYSERVFTNLRQELSATLGQLEFESVEFFPVSAASGTNVVHRSSTTPWYQGPSLLEYLESVDVTRTEHIRPFRLPVQLVQRTSDFRGYSGQITSGSIAVGDSITVLPSLRQTLVKSIVTLDGELDEAIAPQSVTLTVEDEVDISRGDLLAAAYDLPFATRSFRAQMIWFSEQELMPGRRYLLKHTAQTTAAEVGVESRFNIQSLEFETAETLQMNDIGVVTIETNRRVLFDLYRENRRTGSFILIDPGSNNTVAAGMILAPVELAEATAADLRGLLVHAEKDDLVIKVLQNFVDGTTGTNVVILSNWNARAVELLMNAGIHVVVLAKPPQHAERQ